MPKGKIIKGNESSQKTPQELLAEISKKCNGEHGRYKTRKMVADAKHRKN